MKKLGELSTSQDGMNMLAVDTGGRGLFNSEALTNAVDRALSETSNYYLLAWRPNTEVQKVSGFRKFEVSVIGRTDLSIRLPKGYLANLQSSITTATTTETGADIRTSPTEKPADLDLKRALLTATSQESIPIAVSASFVDAPGTGAIVTAGVQTQATALNYGSDGKQAAVDVAGVILNDQGKVVESFRRRLAVDALPVHSGQDTSVAYNYKAKLAPGLYQVRAAIRGEKSATVVSTPPRKLSMEGMTDLGRIPYAGQFPLESLPLGRYELQITINDRFAKTTASQRIPFQIN